MEIVPVHFNDAWISFKLSDMCSNFNANGAVLEVWRPNCCKPKLVCEEVQDPCGCGTKQIWKTVYPEPDKVTIDSTEVDCDGAAIFHLNEDFFALGKGRLKGKVTACNEDFDVDMQLMSLKSAKGKTGKYNATTPYIVEAVTVGRLAVLPDNCRIPNGYTPVLNGTTIIGYATTRPMNQFCKPYTKDCTTIYLIKP